MLSRRLTATLVGAAAVGLLATTGCSEQAAAIRVGDQHVSQSDFMDEVDERFDEIVAEMPSEQLEDGEWPVGEFPRGQLVDSYDQEYLGIVAQQRVQLMLFRELAEAEGLEVTEAQLASAVEQLPAIREQYLQQQQAFPFDYLPTELQEEALAINNLIGEQPNVQELEQELQDLAANADVDVNPKYGTWDADAFAAGQSSVLPAENGALVEGGSEGGGEDGSTILQGSNQE